VTVGALARHAAVERDAAAAAAQPLLRQALRHVAHPTIRNRGTSVGSLVHADPSGELTAVLALTGGTVTLARAAADDGTTSERVVGARDFFLGPLESAVEPGELATHAWFPANPARTGTAFTELARRHGDYAMCGVAASVTLDTAYGITSARAAYLAMGPTPVLVDVTQAAPAAPEQLGQDAAWSPAGDLAAGLLDPEPDIHATADYRRHLARVLTARALAAAARTASALTGRES
jgi:aerobic carbon-monoxide dehydrogenase medium subunit